MIVFVIAVKIIIYILLALLAIFMLVLFVPFRYQVEGSKYETAMVDGFADWLFGAVKIRFDYSSQTGSKTKFGVFGFKKSLEKGKSKQGKKPIEKITEANDIRKEKDKPAYSYIKYEVFTQILKYVLKLLNHYKPSKFNIDARVGFEDPLYTGLLCAIKNSGFAILDKTNISLQTTFEDEILEGSFLIGGEFQIFYLILVAIEFVFTKPFRSIVFKNIKFNINRRLKKWRIVSILMKV